MKKMKVVLLPLDERPCNYNFPSYLFEAEDFNIIRPERLGDKKKPASLDEVSEFLIRECKNAEAAVIAMDTLLYGGLIPSRLHHLSREKVEMQLDVIRRVKKETPSIKIYAFQCIMRCPRYSSDDEEPDYYGICGTEIHRLGNAIHKEMLSMECEYNKEELLAKIPPEALKDYLDRREFNLSFDLETLSLAEEGLIDFLIIPQDDSAPYGYTALDQIVVRKEIAKRNLSDRILIYPGADELELTLLSRVMNELYDKQPKVYVKFASVHAPFLIPGYEDRALGESVKYQLMAAGCIQVESIAESDFILALSAGAFEMIEAANQPANNKNYDVERNLTEFMYFIKSYMKEGKPITIGDNAYSNGSDLELLSMLNKSGIMLRLAGYAGWNTSANTMGTAIAEGVRYLYYGDDLSHKRFLLLRYLEDAGYCAVVRKKITQKKLPELGMNYFDVKERDGLVSKLVKEELEVFVAEKLSSIAEHIHIDLVGMPWKRMFEVDIRVTFR